MAQQTKPRRGFFAGVAGNRRVLYGSYSIITIVVIVAAVVLVNVLATALEGLWDLRVDLTQNRVYTLSKATHEVLDGLQDDVTVYTLYQTGNSNDLVNKTLEKYASASSKIHVENFDPVRNAVKAGEYVTDQHGQVERNWLVVENTANGKFRVIREEDLYQANTDTGEMDLYIEQMVTSAVLYVTSQTSPTVHILQGHGEPGADRLSVVIRQLEAQNYEVSLLDTTKSDTPAPDPGDTLVIIAPINDLTDAEYNALRAYMVAGGKVLFSMLPRYVGEGVITTQLPNFEALLGVYGGDIRLNHDLVMEDDPGYYLSDVTILRPALQTHDITAGLAQNRLSAALFYTQSLSYLDTSIMYLTVSPLLVTSSTAFAKADIDKRGELFSAREPETDLAGPFTVGLAVDYQPETGAPGRMVVYGSGDLFCDDTGISIGGNLALFVSTIGYLNQQDASQSLVIPIKSFGTALLNIPDEQSLRNLAIAVTVVIPVLVLAGGVAMYIYRRHK